MGLEFESGTQEQVDVACMTSDFAMQNVLIQVSNLNSYSILSKQTIYIRLVVWTFFWQLKGSGFAGILRFLAFFLEF